MTYTQEQIEQAIAFVVEFYFVKREEAIELYQDEIDAYCRLTF